LHPYSLIADARVVNQPLTAHVDHSAHLLTIIALEHSVTGDRRLVGIAKSIIDSIIELDRANGLDGFLPMTARSQYGSLVVVNNWSRANNFTQLLVAYNTAYRLFEDPKIREAIRKHVTLIAQYYARNEFILRDNNGRELPYSNLSPVFFNSLSSILKLKLYPESAAFPYNASRRMDALLLIETGLNIIDKHENHGLFEYLQKKRREFTEQYGYLKNIHRLHVELGVTEYPTPSTHWLNFLILNALRHLNPAEQAYATAIESLFRAQDGAQNPFFGLLYFDAVPNVHPERKRIIEDLTQYVLSTFPLTLTNEYEMPKLDGSYKTRVRRFKLKRGVTEVVPPLPVHSRYLRNCEWKESAFRLINPKTEPIKMEFNGADYLSAYWLLQSVRKS